MIAVPPHRRPVDEPDARRSSETAPAAAPGRFADLLATRQGSSPHPTTVGEVAASVPDRPEPAAPPADPRLPDAGARVFNQDGFFGDAVAAEPTAAVRLEPAGDGAAGAPCPTDHSEPTAEPVQVPRPGAVSVARRGRGEHRPAISGRNPVGEAMPAPRPGQPTAAQRVQGERFRPRPAPRTAPPPRQMPLPSMAAAVAVHALAHGLDVVARVADLDPVERARLADEIAALLSAHGYPPGTVRVAAVPSSSLREPR